MSQLYILESEVGKNGSGGKDAELHPGHCTLEEQSSDYSEFANKSGLPEQRNKNKKIK